MSCRECAARDRVDADVTTKLVLLVVIATVALQLYVLRTQQVQIERLEDAVMKLSCIVLKD
jgi:hypothetical protein